MKTILNQIQIKLLHILIAGKVHFKHLLEKEEDPYPVRHPMTHNEWVYSYHDNHRENIKAVYLNRLNALKEDVRRSIQLTNCRLSLEQITELEDIKSKLKLYA